MINTKPEDIAKSGLETALFFANTAFDSIEALTVLNLNASRSLFETSYANLSALLGVKDFKSFLSLQQSLAAPTIEKGLDYSRNVYSITNGAKDKVAKEVEAKVSAAKEKVSGLVDKALASAPAGSEVAVAAVKSAIAAANNAYEGLNKASKQAAEVAEASVAAATKATLNAASAVAPKGKAA